MEVRPVAEYPARWEADVVLADGGTVHVRPIRPEDDGALAALHGRLSAETVYLRFFSPMPRLSSDLLHRFTHVDYQDRMALVAELGDDLIGVARYDRLPGTRDAEVAFVVDDAHQGRGLGTLLLEHLAVAARECGIHRFVAETLPQNRRMLDVFRAAGFGDERSFGDGVVAVSFHIDPTPQSVAAAERRAHVASLHSVERLLAPRSIAVVGASRDAGSIGNEIFLNLLRSGFAGPVYPVHPTAFHIASVRAHASILDVPDEVDLAVVVVPADAVPAVVDECAVKRVRALVVITAGIADERALVERARRNGMRLLGPNCMGVANTSPGVRMNATIAPVLPPHGGVALASQSGALGIGILETAADVGLGMSTFVSMGDKADVSGNDLLEYWEDDPETDVVLLYLESFGNPRRFARVARRVSRRKPIVAVKAGRGARGTDAAVDALFRQTGVIRVDTLEHLFDVARVLASQPLPEGRRVAIVANAGGPTVLAADACEQSGLEVAGGPIELPIEATAEEFGDALRAALSSPDVDSAIAIFTPPVAARAGDVAAEVARAAAESTKPVIANLLGHGSGDAAAVPVFRWPENAVHALARVTEHAEWLRRPEGELPSFDDVDTAAARDIVETALDRSPNADGLWLDPASTRRLLATYGLVIDASAPPGVETIAGVVQHESFGPLVMFGSGGPAAEVIGDLAFRVLPLTDRDAAELVRSIRGAPLLHGTDVDALVELLLRVGRLVDDVPEVSEMDLRPVVVSATGASVVDARVRVAPYRPRPEAVLRRLR